MCFTICILDNYGIFLNLANRGAHGAVEAARVHVENGYQWVVDMDLEMRLQRTLSVAERQRLAHMNAAYPRRRLRAEGAYLYWKPTNPMPENHHFIPTAVIRNRRSGGFGGGGGGSTRSSFRFASISG